MLSDITINLDQAKANALNETYASQFANQIKFLLRYLSAPRQYMPTFVGASRATPAISITGTRGDLASFSNVIKGEKRYMDSYLKHGLSDSRVLNDKHALEKAIYAFERETGLKWPLK